MVMEMNLLSLNSDGAFRTMMHSRMPHSRNRNSTATHMPERGEGEKRRADLLFGHNNAFTCPFHYEKRS